MFEITDELDKCLGQVSELLGKTTMEAEDKESILSLASQIYEETREVPPSNIYDRRPQNVQAFLDELTTHLWGLSVSVPDSSPVLVKKKHHVQKILDCFEEKLQAFEKYSSTSIFGKMVHYSWNHWVFTGRFPCVQQCRRVIARRCYVIDRKGEWKERRDHLLIIRRFMNKYKVSFEHSWMAIPSNFIEEYMEAQGSMASRITRPVAKYLGSQYLQKWGGWSTPHANTIIEGVATSNYFKVILGAANGYTQAIFTNICNYLDNLYTSVGTAISNFFTGILQNRVALFILYVFFMVIACMFSAAVSVGSIYIWLKVFAYFVTKHTATVDPKVKEHVEAQTMEIFEKIKPVDMVSQGGESIVATVFSVGYALLFNEVPGPMNRDLSGYLNIFRFSESISKGLQKTFDALPKITDELCCWYHGVPSTAQRLTKTFEDELSKAEVFLSLNLSDFENLMATSADKAKEVISCYYQLTWIKQNLLKDSGFSSHQKNNFLMVYTKMRDLYKIAMKSVSMHSDRQVPVFLWLYGDTGVGKSTFINILSSCVYSKLAEMHLVKGKYTTLQRHERKAGTEFWDGYCGQWLTTFDDIFQSKVQEDRKLTALEVIYSCQGNVFPLNMAHLENKGLVCFDSKFVVATTNEDHATAQLGIKSSKALLRRRDIVLEVKRVRNVASPDSFDCYKNYDFIAHNTLSPKIGFDPQGQPEQGRQVTFEQVVSEILRLYVQRHNNKEAMAKQYMEYDWSHVKTTFKAQADDDVEESMFAKINKTTKTLEEDFVKKLMATPVARVVTGEKAKEKFDSAPFENIREPTKIPKLEVKEYVGFPFAKDARPPEDINEDALWVKEDAQGTELRNMGEVSRVEPFEVKIEDEQTSKQLEIVSTEKNTKRPRIRVPRFVRDFISKPTSGPTPLMGISWQPKIFQSNVLKFIGFLRDRSYKFREKKYIDAATDDKLISDAERGKVFEFAPGYSFSNIRDDALKTGKEDKHYPFNMDEPMMNIMFPSIGGSLKTLEEEMGILSEDDYIIERRGSFHIGVSVNVRLEVGVWSVATVNREVYVMHAEWYEHGICETYWSDQLEDGTKYAFCDIVAGQLPDVWNKQLSGKNFPSYSKKVYISAGGYGAFSATLYYSCCRMGVNMKAHVGVVFDDDAGQEVKGAVFLMPIHRIPMTPHEFYERCDNHTWVNAIVCQILTNTTDSALIMSDTIMIDNGPFTPQTRDSMFREVLKLSHFVVPDDTRLGIALSRRSFQQRFSKYCSYALVGLVSAGVLGLACYAVYKLCLTFYRFFKSIMKPQSNPEYHQKLRKNMKKNKPLKIKGDIQVSNLMKAQGLQQDTLDVAHKLMRFNFEIGVHGDVYRKVARIQMVKGNVGVIAGHTLKGIGPVKALALYDANGGEGSEIFLEGNFSLHEVPEKDLCYVVLGNPRRPTIMAPDFVRHIPTQSFDGAKLPCRITLNEKGLAAIFGTQITSAGIQSYNGKNLDGSVYSIDVSKVYRVSNCPGAPGHCGFPYILGGEGIQKRFVGIHVAGCESASQCAAIEESEIQAALAPYGEDVEPLTSQEPLEVQGFEEYSLSRHLGDKVEPIPGVTVLGLSARRDYIPTESEIKPLPFIKEVGPYPPIHPVKYKPALLRNTMRDNVKIDPSALAFKKYGKRYNPGRVPLDLPVDWEGLFPKSLAGRTFRVLTVEEAIFGNPLLGVPPVPRNTSMGWPWIWKAHKKIDYINWDKQIVHPVLKDAIGREMMNLLKGPIGLVYLDCLKDELRPIEKVEQGKTRLFARNSFHQFIVARMLFGHLVCAHGDMSGAMSGALNHETYAWKQIVEYFQQLGPIEELKFSAGDFGNFDISHLLIFMHYAYDAIRDFFPDPVHRKLIYHYLLSKNTCIHVYRDLVYVSRGSSPSGDFLTLFVNNIINRFLHWFCWHVKYPLEPYHKYVRDKYVGDDCLVATLSKFPDFNQQTIAETLKSYFGMEYTSAAKESVTELYTSFDKVTFCKRRFVFRDGFWLAPLEQDAIEKIVQYSKEDKMPVHVSQFIAVDTALREWFHYGKEVYEHMREEYNKRLIQMGSTHNRVTWDERWLKFTQEYYDL